MNPYNNPLYKYLETKNDETILFESLPNKMQEYLNEYRLGKNDSKAPILSIKKCKEKYAKGAIDFLVRTQDKKKGEPFERQFRVFKPDMYVHYATFLVRVPER